MRKLMILAALAMIFPVISQAKTLDDLLAEKGIVSQEDVRASHGGAKVYWNKGTRLDFPDTGFSTKVFTEIRTRYEFVDTEDDGSDSNTSNVDVTEARVGIAGHMLNREFTYFVKAALTSDAETTTAGADLLDAYITWAPCDMGSVQIGQFKSAVSRQYGTDLVNLQLPDRSVTSDHFDLGRQQGVAANLDVIDGVDLTLQVLNGEGPNATGANTDHTYVAAVRIPLAGELDAYQEGDINNTEDLAADIGASYAFIKMADLDTAVISADINVKSNGNSLHAEYFQNDVDVAGGSSLTDNGGYVQAGHFLTAGESEIAARYSILDCETSTGACSGNNKVNEATVSYNYYWWKSHLKGQLGYSYLNEDPLAGDDLNTSRWLVQLSGWF